MQTQERQIPQSQRDAEASAAEKAPELTLRSAPLELDLSQLRHVSGGDGAFGPHKTW